MRLSLLTLALLLTLPNRAQQPAATPDTPPPTDSPQTSTLSVQVRVVAIDSVVRNKQTGVPNLNLERDSFALRVDGHPTPIRYFSHDSDLPLIVGLLIDTSGSQHTFFDQEALAADIFFRNTLIHAGDRAFLSRFDSRTQILQPLTYSLRELHNGLRLLDYQYNPYDRSQSGQTLLYDAIGLASTTFPIRQPGRHALVILTDGEDNGSHLKLDAAIREAELADVAVYSVLFTRDMIGNTRYPSVPGHASGIDIMQEISHATGGRSFIVGAGTPVSTIFSDIADDLRNQYRLGFTPPESKPGKKHSIDLRVLDKSLSIQARTGYFTPE
jgi:VWFA-related protein